MNIILFTNSLDFGGASTFFIRLEDAFKDSNIKSSIVAFNNERDNNQDNLLQKSLKYRIKYLRDKCKKNNTDTIITNYGLETIVAKLSTVGLSRKVKIISVVHVRSFMWIPDSMNFLKKLIFKFLIKLSFGICDKCVAVSNDLKEELIKEKWVNKNKIVTIYNPVIQDNFNRNVRTIKSGQSINLGIIGWVWDIKNQEDAIRALYELGDSRYKLHIIGGIKDENYYSKLIQLIKELNLQNQVVFEGVKRDIFKELEKIDILLLTSKTEALPTVIIEALACGVPVVASDCKVGPREILDNGYYGDLYISKDIKGLVNSIVNMSTDLNLYKQISAKSLIRAKDFTYKKAMLSYKSLIEK